MEICKNCLHLCTINFELFIRQDGSMKRSFYIVYTLVFLWAQSAIHAQDSLFFIQVPGQRYVYRVDNSQTQYLDTIQATHTIALGEVTPHQVWNGKQYYFNPIFNAPLAYQAGKVYYLKDNTENLFLDFTLPSGSSYPGFIPGTNIPTTMTITATQNGYEVTGWPYTFYFERTLGIKKIVKKYSYLPPGPIWITIETTVKELKYQNPDGSIFLYQTPVGTSFSPQMDDSIFTPSLYTKMVARHSYTGLYPYALDFWDSVKAYVLYVRPDRDTIVASFLLNRRMVETFEATLPLAERLLKDGYGVRIYFTMTDRGVGPNVFRRPASGYYTIKHFGEATDFYSTVPDFKNYYNKYFISADDSDTIFVGEVQHEFRGDTLIGSGVYKRENLFGEDFYFTLGADSISATFYWNDQGVLRPFAWDTLRFCVEEPRMFHYFGSGEKLKYLGEHSDTMAGIHSTVYHFKGGGYGHEELIYKAGTGPLQIVRNELAVIGIWEKYMYRLTRVSNNGVVTGIYSHPEPVKAGELPTSLMISDNYPNPFNPLTTVRISVRESAVITFTLFNSSGERVSAFTREYPSAGEYHERIDMSGHPSGAWFLSVTDQNSNRVKLLKLMYLK